MLIDAASMQDSPSRLDDEIFEHTLKTLPELSENSHEKLTKMDEEWLKSEDGKKRWREFINSFVSCAFPFDIFHDII